MFDATPEAQPPLFHVLIQQNPLRPELIDCNVEAGCTLAELGADDQAVLAWVNGERELNLDYRPRAGEVVMLRCALAGGDNGKTALAIVATLAVAFVSAGVGITGIPALGISGGTWASAAAGAAIGVVGNLAINALIPPPSQSLDLGGYGSASSARTASNANRAIPFGAVPRTYGTDRIYPPLAALPYTETQGEAQYLVMRFCLGFGPLQKDIADVKIGTTLLSSFGDEPGAYPEHEFFDGTTGSARDVPIYARNTVEESLSIVLESNADSAVRTTAASTGEVSLDFVAPAMIRINEEGKRRTCAVAIKIEYKPSGGSTWTTVSSVGDFEADGAAVYPPENFTTHFPWTTAGTPGTNTGLVKDSTTLPPGGPFPPNAGPALFIIGKDSKPFRAGIRIKLPSAGSWDVRATRVAGYIFSSNNWFPIDTEEEEATTKVYWTAIRSSGEASEATLVPGLEYFDLRIRLTDQLGGTVDRLNMIVSSILPTWNGSAWVDAVTDNPAFIYRDVHLGSANSEPVDSAKFDDTTIKAWASECTAGGRKFNGTFDRHVTVLDAANSAASCGRGSTQIRDTLYSAVRDRPGISRSQIFSRRNSWDYGGSKQFVEQPHAIKAKFRDAESDYTEVERIVYSDGYSLDGAGGTEVATRFEELSLFGVTHRDQAWRETRYHMAQAKLRPEFHVWTCDAENLISQRGDVVGLAHEAALLGIGSARIKSIAGSNITTDETFTLASGSKEVVFRKSTGVLATASTTTSGTTDTLTISGGVPGGVAAGDLILVGTPLDVLITGIEYFGNLRARITAVPYSSPGVHNADSGTIPDFDPGITLPVEFPPAPIIISATPGFRKTPEGPRIPRIAYAYVIPLSDVPVAKARGRFRDADDVEFEVLDERPASGVYVMDVPAADSLYVGGIGLVSDKGVPGPYAEALVDFDWAVAGDLTSIGLVEVIDVPDTRTNRLSTIIATVPPPSDLTRYQAALVEYQIAGRVRWETVGYTDALHQASVAVKRNGETYNFRARAVSTLGVINDSGPMGSIVVSNVNTDVPDPDAALTPYAELNVTNLRIRGELAAVTTWVGPRLRLQWDAPAAPPTGHRLLDYRVILKQAGTSNILHLEYVTRARFDYELERNIQDSLANLGLSSPQRAIDVEVIARSTAGGKSAVAATKASSNPAPTLPTTSYKGLLNAIRIRFDRPTDGDYANTIVYGSQTSGFTPGPSNVLYDGKDTKPIFTPDLLAGVWYIRIELYDDFGPGTISAEVAVTVGSEAVADTTPPTVPGTLTLSSEVGDADQVTNVTLNASWGASTDDSGKLRYELEVWRTDKPTQIWTRNTKNTSAAFPNALAGFNYTGRVRAIDAALNESAWTANSTHTTVGDTTAPPNVSDFTATPKIGKVAIRWKNPSKSAARDWFETDLHWGTSSGFTPDTSDSSTSRIYRGAADRHVDHDAVVATARYYKIRTLDISGNASSFSAAIGPYTPTADDVPKDITAPSVPTGLALTSAVENPDQVTDVALTMTWDQATDDSGKCFYIVELWPTATPTRVRTRRVRDSGSATTSTTFPGIVAGRSYTGRVKAVDYAGNESAFSSTAAHTATGDTTAPANVSNFATVSKIGRINLNWDNPADKDYSYAEIYRHTTSGFTPPGTGTLVYRGSADRHTDSNGVVAGTTYYYKTRTFDVSGNASAFSAATSGTASADEALKDVTAPTVPGIPSLSQTNEQTDLMPVVSLTASWTASTDPDGSPVTYEVEVWVNTARRRRYRTAATSITLDRARVGATYSVQVRSLDEAGNASAFSTTSTLLITDPTSASNVTGATATGRIARVVVRWTNPTDANWLETEAHRGTTAGFSPSGSTLVYKGRGTQYNDNEISYGTDYYYKFRTIYPHGTVSSYSSATGPAQAATITTVDITDDAITAPKIAANAITAAKISAGAVTADKIAAGAITTDKLTVGDFTNLTENGDFELGDTGWTLNGWSIVNNAGNARRGSWHGSKATTGAADLVSNYKVRCEPGDVFYAQAFGRFAASSTGSGARIEIAWFDSADAEISTSNGNTIAHSVTSYTLTSVTGTAPANTAYCRVQYALLGQTAGTARVDDVRLFNVAGTARIQDAAITTAKIADLSVTTAKIDDVAITTAKIGSLQVTTAKIADAAITNAKVNDLDASKINAGFLAAARIQAGSLSADKLIVGDFTNLLEDPDFELDGAGWEAGGASTMTVGSTNPRTGTKAATRTNTASSSGTYTNLYKVRCQEGDTFFGRAFIRFATTSGTPSGSAQFEIRFYDAADTVLQTSAGNAVSQSVTSYTASDVTATAPANTVYCRARINFTFANRALYVDTCKLHRVTDSVTIKDGAITATKISVSDLSAISATLGSVTAGTITGSTINTATSGQRVELTAGNECRFWDDVGTRAVTIGITSDGSDNVYLQAGLQHDGSTAAGNATQQGRIGLRAYSGTNYAISAWSIDSAGVIGRSRNSVGVVGSSLSGSGTGVLGTAGSGEGVKGTATTGFALYGSATNATSGVGAYGTSAGASGIGVQGVCNTGTGVQGDATSGVAVRGSANAGVGVRGSATTGIGGFFEYTSAGTGNGIGADVNSTTRACVVATAGGLGTSSVGVAARANYAGVFQQTSSTIGGALLLKGNTAGGAIPTHSAECGTIAIRYPSSVAQPYIQTSGDLHGVGTVWRELVVTGQTVAGTLAASVTGTTGISGTATTGIGVAGDVTSGKAIQGEATSGIGVYGTYTSAGTGNGIGASVDFTTRCAGLFNVSGLGTDSVGIACRANYAGVMQQNSNTLGGSLLIKANSSNTSAPTHTAEAGSICIRFISSVATLFLQTAGGHNGTGSTWVALN